MIPSATEVPSPLPLSSPTSTSGSAHTLEFVLRQRVEPENFNEQLAELIAQCKGSGITEVLLYPHGALAKDSPTGFWDEPEVAEAVRLLTIAKDALDQHGISMGLNLWNSIGHGDRGRVAPPGYQLLVSEEGVTSKSQPCPLCPSWRSYMKDCLRAYAAVRPAKFFYDDDLRHFNHTTDEGTGRVNCFCPLHLERFNRVSENSLDRTSLLEAILTTHGGGSIRHQWMNDLNTIMLDLFREFEECIHEVSPETEVGLMSSGADQVLLEGRDFRKLLPVVGGPGQRILYRPCFSYYIEPPARDIPAVLALYRSVLGDLPEEAVLYAEIDNCMPTEYNSSPLHMASRMMLAALCGTRAFHLSLFGCYGNADTFSTNAAYVSILPRLQKSLEPVLAGLRAPGGRPLAHGIRIPRNPLQVVGKEQGQAKSVMDLLANSLWWAKPLQLAGFPITFDPAPLCAVTEDSFWGLSEKEIDHILKQRTLLDFTAIRWLSERGYGERIGVKGTDTLPTSRGRAVFVEEVTDACDPALGSLFEHTPLHSPPYECRIHTTDAVKPLTILRGRGEQRFGTGAFEARPEGSAGVMGLPLFPEVLEYNPFLCHYRINVLRRWVEEGIRDAGAPFFHVPDHPNGLPLHLQYGADHLLAWMNLRSQDATGVTLRCYGIPHVRNVYLWREAELSPLPFTIVDRSSGEYDLRVPSSVPPYAVLIARS